MQDTTRAIVSGAIRDVRGSWRALALTDLAYKLVSFALLTPLTVLLLRWAMARAGTAVVADVEIATFFLTTRPGILSLILGGAILTGITALEIACLLAIGFAAANGRHLTVRSALAFGASRALSVLRLTTHMVARLLAGLVPFAAAIGVVYWTLMRDHDINFYLSQRPPSFWTAVSIAAVIVALLAILLVRTLADWALALPLVLFEAVLPRRALGESATRLTGHRSSVVAALAVWAALSAALLAVAAWVPQFIGRGLAPQVSGSMDGLLAFITGLVLLWAVLGLLRLYLRVVARLEPGAQHAGGLSPCRRPGRRLRRARRAGVRRRRGGGRPRQRPDEGRGIAAEDLGGPCCGAPRRGHRQPQGSAIFRRANAHPCRGARHLQRPGPRRRRAEVLWPLPAARGARRRNRRGRGRGGRHHLHVARSRHDSQAEAASAFVAGRRARREGHRRPHLARHRFSRGRSQPGDTGLRAPGPSGRSGRVRMDRQRSRLDARGDEPRRRWSDHGPSGPRAAGRRATWRDERCGAHSGGVARCDGREDRVAYRRGGRATVQP